MSDLKLIYKYILFDNESALALIRREALSNNIDISKFSHLAISYFMRTLRYKYVSKNMKGYEKPAYISKDLLDVLSKLSDVPIVPPSSKYACKQIGILKKKLSKTKKPKQTKAKKKEALVQLKKKIESIKPDSSKTNNEYTIEPPLIQDYLYSTRLTTTLSIDSNNSKTTDNQCSFQEYLYNNKLLDIRIPLFKDTSSVDNFTLSELELIYSSVNGCIDITIDEIIKDISYEITKSSSYNILKTNRVHCIAEIFELLDGGNYNDLCKAQKLAMHYYDTMDYESTLMIFNILRYQDIDLLNNYIELHKKPKLDIKKIISKICKYKTNINFKLISVLSMISNILLILILIFK